MTGYKTYVGIAIALAPTIAHLFGYQVTDSFGADLPALADTIMQIVGLCVATYGRLVAQAPGWLAKQPL